jgi:hypothetical protein
MGLKAEGQRWFSHRQEYPARKNGGQHGVAHGREKSLKEGPSER